MPKRRFSDTERYAVYIVHGEKCYICSRPLDLMSVEVDHVVPERLIDHPAELTGALALLGLPETFDIHSYENWMPACGPCNSRKASTPWAPSLLVQQALQRASAKAASARATAQEIVSRRAIANAINALHRAEATGTLTEADKLLLESLVAFQLAHREPEMAGQPIRLSPFLEVLSDDGWRVVARGRYGVGGRPSATDVHPSFDCPRCGPTAWSGARCVICGDLSDD